MTFQYWFMLPVAAAIATIAMASGVGGATFFVPVFILALRLPPEVAIGTGLITEVFGFASGLFAYMRRKLIDYRLGMALLSATLPLALVGSWLAGRVDQNILKVILGLGLFAVALSFLRSPNREEVGRLDEGIKTDFGKTGKSTLVTADGEKLTYTVCNRIEGRIIAGLGGLFVGLILTGLGELNGYFLLQRCRVPSKISVATSVFIVAATALVASAGHLVRFVQSGSDVLTTVLSLVVFTVPGVIVGAQIGPFVADRIPQRVLELLLGILFILIAVLTIGEVVIR